MEGVSPSLTSQCKSSIRSRCVQVMVSRMSRGLSGLLLLVNSLQNGNGAIFTIRGSIASATNCAVMIARRE